MPPPGYIGFKLPPEQAEGLKDLARLRGHSVGAECRAAVAAHLIRLARDEQRKHAESRAST